MRLTAVVDLGSNSFRLVVYRYEPGGAWAVWDEIRAPVRLSAGMGADGLLRPERIERALEAVRMFVAFCRQTGIDDVVAAGTSALRRAANGEAVLAACADAGLPARILDGREEAFYGALAILNTTTVRDGLGLDMGGGSVQLMRLAGGRMTESVSLPLGAVRTTEDFLAANEGKGIVALRAHVRELVEGVPWFRAASGPLGGIGGSVRNLAAAAQRLHDLPDGGVQGFVLTAAMLDAVLAELTPRDAHGRGQLPGISQDRGDVILGASVVLQTVLAAGGFDGVEVTEAGLREGLFFERYLDGLDPPVHADAGEASVRNLVLRHGSDEPHVQRVAGHAMAIYDGLAAAGVIAPDDHDRRLLGSAALLHDVGRAIAYDDRHKHARHLITVEGLPGLLRDDVETIAQIVRYLPKGRPEAETAVELLAGVLRIAEQLERTRAGDVESVAVVAEGDVVRILVEPRGEATVGLWIAARSTGLLAAALGREVQVLSRLLHSGFTGG